MSPGKWGPRSIPAWIERTDAAFPCKDRFIVGLVHPKDGFSFLVDVEALIARTLPALIAAGLVVVGSFAAAVAVSSPSRFLGEARAGENPLAKGLLSPSPTPNSWGGAVIAAILVGNRPL